MEEAAPPLPGALLQEVPPEEPAQEAVQGVLQGAAPELLLPGLEVIIMKQDVLPPADMVEDAGGPDFRKIAIGGVILVLAIFCVAFLMKKVTGSQNNEYGAGNRDYRS